MVRGTTTAAGIRHGSSGLPDTTVVIRRLQNVALRVGGIVVTTRSGKRPSTRFARFSLAAGHSRLFLTVQFSADHEW